MDSRSAEILEFDFIRQDLKSFCIGPEGAKLIDDQEFLNNRAVLDSMLERVDFLKRLIESDISIPALGLPEITGALERVRKDGALIQGLEIAAVGEFIKGSAVLNRYVSKALDERSVSPLAEECATAPNLQEVSDFIFANIDEDGAVKETLPVLRVIRRKMRNTQSDIASLAAKHLQNQASIWQTNVPTQKDGRLVLPLKADHRGRVKGIIREISSSGATIFLEPFDLVEKNNNYALLENEYKIEVAKILMNCSESIRAHREELLVLLQHTAYIDTILARARFAARHGCTRAEAMDKGFRILDGRHPILGNNAVPIEVELGDEKSVLIITGPNAGGKTVTLKMIGLFALMNQFGMCIPAGEGTGFQLYTEILADIGDDQSIEESLSTFSGHMKNIARFSDKASRDALILLDELGSGTDPEEGSAIAMAVLDRFLERDAIVVTTTHQSVLKNYAFSKPGVTNASVSFDPDTHRPTYSIVLGLPGESHALEIAENSGMSHEILTDARRYLDEQSTDIAQIIREITAQQRSLSERETEYEKRKGDLLENIRETDLRSLRLKQRETELRTQGYMQLTKQIQESRKQLENLVKELREGELTKDKRKAVKQYIEKLEQTASKEREEITEVQHELAPDQKIEQGMDVLIGSSRQRGKVVRQARKGYWIVSTEKLKVTVPESDIKVVVETAERKRKVRVEHTSNGAQPVFTLDVRGHRLTEALDELEKQIDRALMASLAEFEVIHGHGEGVLQKGVHDHLHKHPAVKGYKFAMPEEGGFGKTIVKL
jgi:DNA mismatch repair protein MutS2